MAITPVVYIIEGVTCSGKSTLAKRCVESQALLLPSDELTYISDAPAWSPVYGLELAPEHTPEPYNGGSLCNRQRAILEDFARRQDEITELIRRDMSRSIVMDFSTFGVSSFSNALREMESTRINGRNADRLARLSFDADKSFYRWRKELLSLGASVYLTILLPPPCVIEKRLKNRARPGDDAWGPELIRELCKAYRKSAINHLCDTEG